MAIPVFEVEFDKNGNVVDPQQVTKALDGIAAAQAGDLLVLSHGWNNDMADARQLYAAILARIEAQLPAAGQGRTFAALEIFWPSKKFTDTELIPGGAAALGDGDLDPAVLISRLEALKSEPQRLGVEEVVPERAAALTQAQALVPNLDNDLDAQRQFVEILRAQLPKDDADPDDGSDGFFEKDPVELLQSLSEPVPPPPLPAGGGGAAMLEGGGEGGLEGGAAGLGDFFSGAKAGAGRLLNFFTYYQMKKRAGLVGRTGAASVLRQIHGRLPQLKLHLIGHSFGGRLVTAAADALGPAVPVTTLTLLQAAYSHNGLGQKYDGTHDGFFRQIVTQKKIAGPLLITHTKNDKAVGIAYPLASRLSGDVASALGDANDPYGGMGRNGAQKTPEVDAAVAFLDRVGTQYRFKVGKIYNLNADEFIKGHSDIAKDEVAFALLTAVALT
ncbi:MAG TPA: hypothetical protein VGX68_21435 [Thermoanaerobaculia bacterium]|jgi:esterase/lipase superfamily enzyme|nr:hypothetical protein [Thermoanaerobaculia bacterium]